MSGPPAAPHRTWRTASIREEVRARNNPVTAQPATSAGTALRKAGRASRATLARGRSEADVPGRDARVPGIGHVTARRRKSSVRAENTY
jgi:hypothetical protein